MNCDDPTFIQTGTRRKLSFLKAGNFRQNEAVTIIPGGCNVKSITTTALSMFSLIKESKFER